METILTQKEKAKVYRRAYYLAHREELCAYSREYGASHYDENKPRLKQYAIDHHKEISRRIKQRRESHPEVYAARDKANREKLRNDILQHYGGKCVCCGEAAYEFLAIDHIDGNGNAHRRAIGQSNLYRWIRKNGYPDNFQVLCHNCNNAKGFYGYCPHQKVDKECLE